MKYICGERAHTHTHTRSFRCIFILWESGLPRTLLPSWEPHYVTDNADTYLVYYNRVSQRRSNISTRNVLVNSQNLEVVQTKSESVYEE